MDIDSDTDDDELIPQTPPVATRNIDKQDVKSYALRSQSKISDFFLPTNKIKPRKSSSNSECAKSKTTITNDIPSERENVNGSSKLLLGKRRQDNGGDNGTDGLGNLGMRERKSARYDTSTSGADLHIPTSKSSHNLGDKMAATSERFVAEVAESELETLSALNTSDNSGSSLLELKRPALNTTVNNPGLDNKLASNNRASVSLTTSTESKKASASLITAAKSSKVKKSCSKISLQVEKSCPETMLLAAVKLADPQVTRKSTTPSEDLYDKTNKLSQESSSSTIITQTAEEKSTYDTSDGELPSSMDVNPNENAAASSSGLVTPSSHSPSSSGVAHPLSSVVISGSTNGKGDSSDESDEKSDSSGKLDSKSAKSSSSSTSVKMCTRASGQMTLKNKEFYSNLRKSEPRGDFIDNILRDWYGCYDKLEDHHGYIQWLFPTDEATAFNSCAQKLLPEEAEYISTDGQCRRRLVKAYKLMLNFYGLQVASGDHGRRGLIELAANYSRRLDNLNRSPHNNLRITRIIKCLGQLGHECLQAPLVQFLIKLAFENELLKNCRRSCIEYWIPAVRDEKQRACMEKHEDVVAFKKKMEKESSKGWLRGSSKN